MSSLNKAFIQVYRKSDRRIQDEGVREPHFRSTSEPLVKETSPSIELPQPIESPSEEKVIFYRVDPKVDTSMILQPWLTSISTYDVEDYVAQSKDSRSARSPSAPTEPTEIDSIETSVLETTHTIEEEDVVLETTPAISESIEPLPALEQLPEVHMSTDERVEPPAPKLDASHEYEEAAEETSSSRFEDRLGESGYAIFPFKKSPSTSTKLEAELPFHAVWEVDSFHWPSIVLDIHRKASSTLTEVGKHLRQACRTGLKVLAVTSEDEGQGRSTIAICLARVAAKMGIKVALIDADLHHPDLAEQLNLELAHGWEEVVANGLPLEETAIHSIEDRITLIPMSCQSNPLQVAPDHPKVQNVLRRLAMSFDLVIVDSQHLAHPRGRLMGGGIDTPIHAAVLVVDKVYPDDQLLQESVRRLMRQGIESIGIVENFQ